MQITQLRSATLVVSVGPHRILVDPMLAPRGSLPPLRLFDGVRARNPTVDLPDHAPDILAGVTHGLITHCQKGHFDHLDRAGKAWLREHEIPVICTDHDANHLAARGLKVMPLAHGHGQPQALLGGTVRTVPCTHGKGAVKLLMEHGVGYFFEFPGEPTLYLAGDTVLTPEVMSFVEQQQPDICVVPAGGAHFDLGQELIMDADEVIQFARIAKGRVIANHMEALSHCPVTRQQMKAAAQAAGLSDRIIVPQDGETLSMGRGA